MTIPINSIDPSAPPPGTDPDPALQMRERKISIQFRAPDVSEPEIRAIAHCWKTHIPIVSITRRLQGPRCRLRQPPLIYVDIYSILFVLYSKKIITQRNTHANELTIDDFGQFFREWKQGHSFKQCLLAIKDRPLHQCSEFANQVYRSLSDRWRKEQRILDPAGAALRARKQVSTGNNLGSGVDNQAEDFRNLLKIATRRNVDDRPAVVIFIDQIPVGLLKLLKKMPDGIKYADGVSSGEDFFQTVLKPALPRLDIRTPFEDMDLQALDPDGVMDDQAAANEEINQLERDSRRKLRLRSEEEHKVPPVPATPLPAVEANLPEISDDDDLETAFANLDTAPTPVTDLSLENLADDDPL